MKTNFYDARILVEVSFLRNVVQALSVTLLQKVVQLLRATVAPRLIGWYLRSEQSEVAAVHHLHLEGDTSEPSVVLRVGEPLHAVC